jgi:hypothetical protein
MQIISIIRSLVLLFTVSICFSVLAENRAIDSLEITLVNKQTLVLKKTTSGAVVVDKNNNRLNVKLDPKLAKLLTRAEEISLIFPDPIFELNSLFFVVLVREPSKSKRGTGFCGAGFEDYLLLIEAKSKRLSLLDNILLQSCLNSKELASDKGEGPLKAMRIDAANKSIVYKMLGEDVNKTTTILSRKFHTE